MYCYHALINAPSARMIHINLTMIFYTHVEHSPTKTIYIKYYTEQAHTTHITLHTHTPHTYTRARCKRIQSLIQNHMRHVRIESARE